MTFLKGRVYSHIQISHSIQILISNDSAQAERGRKISRVVYYILHVNPLGQVTNRLGSHLTVRCASMNLQVLVAGRKTRDSDNNTVCSQLHNVTVMLHFGIQEES